MQSYEKRLIYESGVRFFYINFIEYFLWECYTVNSNKKKYNM